MEIFEKFPSLQGSTFGVTQNIMDFQVPASNDKDVVPKKSFFQWVTQATATIKDVNGSTLVQKAVVPLSFGDRTNNWDYSGSAMVKHFRMTTENNESIIDERYCNVLNQTKKYYTKTTEELQSDAFSSGSGMNGNGVRESNNLINWGAFVAPATGMTAFPTPVVSQDGTTSTYTADATNALMTQISNDMVMPLSEVALAIGSADILPTPDGLRLRCELENAVDIIHTSYTSATPYAFQLTPQNKKVRPLTLPIVLKGLTKKGSPAVEDPPKAAVKDTITVTPMQLYNTTNTNTQSVYPFVAGQQQVLITIKDTTGKITYDEIINVDSCAVSAGKLVLTLPTEGEIQDATVIYVRSLVHGTTTSNAILTVQFPANVGRIQGMNCPFYIGMPLRVTSATGSDNVDFILTVASINNVWTTANALTNATTDVYNITFNSAAGVEYTGFTADKTYLISTPEVFTKTGAAGAVPATNISYSWSVNPAYLSLCRLSYAHPMHKEHKIKRDHSLQTDKMHVYTYATEGANMLQNSEFNYQFQTPANTVSTFLLTPLQNSLISVNEAKEYRILLGTMPTTNYPITINASTNMNSIHNDQVLKSLRNSAQNTFSLMPKRLQGSLFEHSNNNAQQYSPVLYGAVVTDLEVSDPKESQLVQYNLYAQTDSTGKAEFTQKTVYLFKHHIKKLYN